jgi:putative heme-binding domain-containing protein
VKPGCLFLLSAGVIIAQENPLHGNKDAIEAGRGMFRIYCSPCHGIGAQGGRGPDLTLGTYSGGNSDASLFKVISEGVQGTEMPAYSERFDVSGIWRLVAYVRSVGGAPTTPLEGDRASGEKLYWGKGGCGACHRIGNRGSRIGPDLTNAGRQRSLAYLRESVVEPNAHLTPGYYTVAVVTRDGQRIQGVQKNYDSFSAQLMDAGEKFHSFWREEVSSMERRFSSLMPSDYGKRFTAEELNDLLAFLAGLRPEREAQ